MPYLLLLAAEVATMHVKITPNDQITSPDQSAAQVEAAGYVDEVDSSAIVVTPVLAQSVEAVRDKLIASGISEKDVADACAWARRPKE
ncbi:AbrB/MazE/SpoVT family DNA-binding domain-containing protein [Candidatus Nitrotoga arctica]|nr:AbrB/MazE/SpoVT family DNA-binding domain-containing protein [Candidatus Nitrotoga arctica]